MNKRSILLITLDSCRFDAFMEAKAANMKSIGPTYCADAPGTFTYSSHAAMFMGFLPSVTQRKERFINSRYARIVRLPGSNFHGLGKAALEVRGRNIIDGLRNIGYRAFGTGAMKWFDAKLPTSRHLTDEFEHFYHPGEMSVLDDQLRYLHKVVKMTSEPIFAFLNLGETHAPYFHKGADWDRKWYPCAPFGADTNDANECRRRQIACIEYVDKLIAPLLEQFAGSTIVICGDHGDCWGEDGLWEHTIYHPKVMEVPLIMQVNEGALSQGTPQSPMWQIPIGVTLSGAKPLA